MAINRLDLRQGTCLFHRAYEGTGKIEIPIKSGWNIGGRVHLRQRDPLPLSVLAVVPNVEVGG